jgi:hypothetical protein
VSQRLFGVSKVGLYCDAITHATEKRKNDEVKIVTLTLRAQPFDAKLATALDQGLGGESNVRPTLFKLNHPDPKPLLRRVDFALGCPRQQLHVFASTDTDKASILLDHVRITGTYARTEKSVAGYGFVLKAAFGPLGRRELEFIQDWHLSQRFVTFEEAEPSLEFDQAGDVEDDGDLSEQDEKARRPAPMFDTTAEGEPIDAPAASESGEAARVLPHRHRDRSSAVRAKQTSTRDGKKGRR